MSAPRKRNFAASSTGNLLHDDSSASATNSESLQLYGLTHRFWLGVIVMCTSLFILVDINYHTFPSAANSVESVGQSLHGIETQTEGRFLEGNARKFTEDVCKFGTRHLGSHANEVLAKDAIVAEVKAIQNTVSATAARSIHKVELDVQSVSGCFDLDFIGNFTSCYSSVKNILVRLSPVADPSTSGLLVNCHYDTAVSSPG